MSYRTKGLNQDIPNGISPRWNTIQKQKLQLTDIPQKHESQEIILRKEVRYKRVHFVLFHLYEVQSKTNVW